MLQALYEQSNYLRRSDVKEYPVKGISKSEMLRTVELLQDCQMLQPEALLEQNLEQVQQASNQALQVVAQVPEELILKVRKGDLLSIAVPAAGVNVSGEVAEVAPAADPFSRTAPVKINIAAGGDLRPGQFARVTLTGAGEKSLVISEKALVSFGQMERVFVVEDKSGDASVKDNSGASKVARLRLVRTGAHHGAAGTTDSRVEIMAGLSLGDRVVVEGAEKLQDGQPLEVKP
jgi:hypothetical protein